MASLHLCDNTASKLRSCRSRAPAFNVASHVVRSSRGAAMTRHSISHSFGYTNQHVPHLRSNICAAVRSRSCASIRCQASSSDAKKSVAITGGTGLIGSRVASKLAAAGWTVKILTRNPSSAKSKLNFPGLQFFAPSQWPTAISGTDAVINLAGEPIGTRWTPSIKQEILRSRIGTTNAVVSAINAAPEDKRPKVLVSASAVGFYGASQASTFNEDSPSGADYLAEVCRQWEAAAQKVPSGVRVAILRIGIVLAPEGGVLAKMKPVFEIFAGGPLGSGRQWISWVHREDLVNMIVEAVNNPQYNGVYNATAPRPVRMSELCSALGSLLGRPSWLPVPDFAIQTLLGEGASVVLDGQRVLPARAQAQGFQFQYNEVLDALRAVYK